jgi:2-C-methyl-D-erythritol 4-phosphate cytidylyltransferase
MPNFFALVPAAGVGSRMEATLPKQYLPLAGRPMLHYALSVLCASPELSRVWVVLAPEDTHFFTYDWSACGDKLQPVFCGGASRAESVLNGLHAAHLNHDDWVLVHDAARPCLTTQLLSKLISVLSDDPIGGLLAVPLADTLKRADAQQRVLTTEPREHLWQAQTPQMFRAGLLQQALQQTHTVTDEASAIEALGLSPKLVLSDNSNFKVTFKQDIQLAEQILCCTDSPTLR